MTDTATPVPAKRQRPLSPHLQVYRPQITSVMSILHRITGVALSFGAVLMVLWLAAAANGSGSYEIMQSYLGSPVGIVLLMGWSWALFYHLANGVRHLLWDWCVGLELPAVYTSGYAVIAATTFATILAWIFGLTLVM
jgi:succinate dehydrogenase / fumarate reductase, cytochrome b subunit